MDDNNQEDREKRVVEKTGTESDLSAVGSISLSSFQDPAGELYTRLLKGGS